MKGQIGNNYNRPASLLKREKNKTLISVQVLKKKTPHAWKPNGRMMSISRPVLYSYNPLQGWDFYTASWKEREAEWHVSHTKKIFEFMRGNSLFHVLISVCSAEAVAFRGVLCGGREESLSVWYIRRSIFHTINLSVWLSMTQAAPLNRSQMKTNNKTEKQSGMNDIYWYQSREYNTSWGEVTGIQILREECVVL